MSIAITSGEMDAATEHMATDLKFAVEMMESSTEGATALRERRWCHWPIRVTVEILEVPRRTFEAEAWDDVKVERDGQFARYVGTRKDCPHVEVRTAWFRAEVV